jgi:hypothetical protein
VGKNKDAIDFSYLMPLGVKETDMCLEAWADSVKRAADFEAAFDGYTVWKGRAIRAEQKIAALERELEKYRCG